MEKLVSFFINLNRNGKILLISFLDGFIMIIAVYLSFIMFNDKILKFSTGPQVSFLLSISIYFIFSYIFKNYNVIHSYFNYRSVFDIFKIILISGLTVFILGFFFGNKYFFFNASYVLNQFTLFFIFICTLRYSIRLLSLKRSKVNKKNVNVFIYGAGISGLNFSELIYDTENVVGFIDDDIRKISGKLNNLKVFSFKQFEDYPNLKDIDKIYICIPSLSSFHETEIIKRLNNLKSKFKIINNNQIKDLSDKNFQIKNDVFKNIEIKKNSLAGKNILVTGAAGTIGKELTFQLEKLKPKKLILIDNNENSISNLEMDLNLNENVKSKIEIKLINLCNLYLLEEIFVREKIDVIFHAAAFKHVSLIENNIKQSFFNNILSTINLIKLSKKYFVKKIIYISSDKAVNPINVLGVCKRIGEKLIKIANDNSLNTSSVRFGNVISSSGSLIPKIHHQIKSKNEIYLTDKNATRYFMTIKDAVNLVIRSTEMELTGDVYVLNMGKPIKIYDIAIKILKSLNLTVYDHNSQNGDVKIRYTGLKEGEKMHEELFFDNKAEKTENANIMKEKITFKEQFGKEYQKDIEKIINNLSEYEVDKLKSYLFNYI